MRTLVSPLWPYVSHDDLMFVWRTYIPHEDLMLSLKTLYFPIIMLGIKDWNIFLTLTFVPALHLLDFLLIGSGIVSLILVTSLERVFEPCASIQLKILQRPRIVELLKSYYKNQWDNIPLQKVKQMDSSVRRCLQAVVNEQRMLLCLPSLNEVENRK